MQLVDPYPTREERRQIVVFVLFSMSFIVFLSAGLINRGLDTLFSGFSLVLNGIEVHRTAVIIAPIVEETMKFLGYGILFLYAFNDNLRLGYWDKFDFIDDYLPIAFVLSAGGFGLWEGLLKNLRFNPFCLISFILLNMFIHLTYAIYPLILGRCHRNQFIFFLPIAMLLHSVHNFILSTLWDNKWVTFIMVTIFLFPVLFILRDKVVSFITKYAPYRITTGHIMFVLFLIYVYMFLCCLLAF
jgi:hypothetical protein